MQTELPPCPICYTIMVGKVTVTTRQRLPVDPGDLILCAGCAGILGVTRDRRFVALTSLEIDELPEEFRTLTYAGREALVDEWMRLGNAPTIYAWVMCEMRRKKQREQCKQ